jgi:hypothetical protein
MKTRILCLALLSACHGAPSEPAAAPMTPSLALAIDDPAMLDRGGPARVMLGQTRHVFARLVTPTLPAPVVGMTLQVIMPSGAIHQQRRIAYSANPSGDMQLARAVPGGWALEFALPVGGTNLERHPQPGRWMVHAQLDGMPDVSFDAPLEMSL